MAIMPSRRVWIKKWDGELDHRRLTRRVPVHNDDMRKKGKGQELVSAISRKLSIPSACRIGKKRLITAAASV